MEKSGKSVVGGTESRGRFGKFLGKDKCFCLSFNTKTINIFDSPFFKSPKMTHGFRRERDTCTTEWFKID